MRTIRSNRPRAGAPRFRGWAAVLGIAIVLACSSETPDSPPLSDVLPEWLRPIDELLPLVEPAFALGRNAPPFRLPVLGWPADQEPLDSLSLAELQGRVTVLDFWNSGCIPCIEEHEVLNTMANRYRSRGVDFIGISAGDSRESLKRFADRFGAFSYPNLGDPGGTVSRLYNTRGVPTKVVIDRSGTVVWWRPGGPIEEEVLVSVLEDVLAGRRPGAPQLGVWEQTPG